MDIYYDAIEDTSETVDDRSVEIAWSEEKKTSTSMQETIGKFQELLITKFEDLPGANASLVSIGKV